MQECILAQSTLVGGSNGKFKTQQALAVCLIAWRFVLKITFNKLQHPPKAGVLIIE